MSDWKNVQYKDGKMRTSEGGGGGGSSTFAGLDDVSFSNIQNGQVPKYNSTTQKWENADESGGGGTVTDVQVDGASVVNQQGVAEIPAIPDGLHNYSTTEQVIGTWIDGKPLYEKCYNITFANGTIGTIDSTFIPKKFNVYMYFSGNDTGDCQSNPFVYDAGNLWTIWIDNRTITGKMHPVYAGKSAVLILQYTKTTDV